MEEKINIAQVLKGKPQGTKLYSPICGECELSYIESEKFEPQIAIESEAFGDFYFWDDGKAYEEGECLLFPSYKMRDWSKFAWKPGDVLVGGGQRVIFEKFIDEDYTNFQGKYSLSTHEDRALIIDSSYYTSYFSKVNDSGNVNNYFEELEEKLGAKLNRETLEIEKAQPEFKDWDFITIKLPRGSSFICVFKAENDENYYLHASLDSRGMITINENSYCSKSGCIVRLSTEEEKTAFFDALARKGKIWDVEKKKIIALKKKWTPKPFDRVITRNADDDIWTANIFSHMDSHGEYVTIGCVGGYTYCIPYNEETAKLIGTTNNVEG